jgi:hypothetical protein
LLTFLDKLDESIAHLQEKEITYSQLYQSLVAENESFQ